MSGTLTLGVLLLYSAALVALGTWIGRRVSTSEAFFVAGRRMGPGLLCATVLAANIGAGSTVGAAGLAWREGLSAWWWVGSAGIGTALLGLWLGPRLWHVARQHDLQTVGDYLELRYSAGVRGVVAALLWLGTLAILAGQLIAMAWVLDAVAGIGKVWGCLLGGVVMTLYFVSGGLASSAWVNLVQLVVLLSGFAIALPLVLGGVGGLEGLRLEDSLAGSVAPPDWWAFGRGEASGPRLLALLVPAFLVSPGLIQKSWAARSATALRWGIGLSALALLVFAWVPTLLGMAARVHHPDLASPDLALPTLLLENVPLWLGMLGLAAVFSAEISSADAILFMLSTSLAKDLWGRFVEPDTGDDPEARDRRILRVARLAAVAGGTGGVALALLLPDVLGALSIFYSLLGVALTVPLIAGLFGSRAGVAEAFAAIAGGTGTLLAIRALGVELPAALPASLVAIGASALAAALAGLIARLRARP